MSSLRGREKAIEAVVNLTKMKADAAIVMHRPGESADEIIERLVAEGWTLDEEVDYLLGKRIRYIHPPEDIDLEIP